MRRTACSQRTAPSTWRTRSSFTRPGSVLGRASTLATTGKASGLTVTFSSSASRAAAAGAISAQWKGALTLSGMALPFSSPARSDTRATARRGPAITIWPGALKFAQLTVP